MSQKGRCLNILCPTLSAESFDLVIFWSIKEGMTIIRPLFSWLYFNLFGISDNKKPFYLENTICAGVGGGEGGAWPHAINET